MGHGPFDGEALVGFVNVAWDGGVHAFLLDTTVHPDWQGAASAPQLVRAGRGGAVTRWALEWLHVDFEAALTDFYAGCGFDPYASGPTATG